jgi:NADH-quinone oxidoreductase subunit L
VVGASLINYHDSTAALWAFALADAALAILGVLVARALWQAVVNRPQLEPRFLYMAWFIDWSLDTFIARPGAAIAAFAATVVENQVLDGAVNGVATLVRSSGDRLRKVQTGYVRTYALLLVGGLILIVAYFIIRSGS